MSLSPIVSHCLSRICKCMAYVSASRVVVNENAYQRRVGVRMSEGENRNQSTFDGTESYLTKEGVRSGTRARAILSQSRPLRFCTQGLTVSS